MRFASPLIEGRLILRYKRFLADVTLADGTVVTAHVPNSGAMLGLNAPGSRVWLSHSGSPTRKYAHTLEMVEADGQPIGVNTSHPNAIAAAAIAAGAIPELVGYSSIRREVKYGRNSRIDLLLEDSGRAPAYVEVKNVHLRRPDRHGGMAAEFPDCVTTRGAKHLVELADMVALGCRAVMLYLVQRTDCDHFRVAHDIDLSYHRGLVTAAAAGVETLCYSCAITPEAILLDRSLPVHLEIA
ncbi:XRE family transcriptional regulator [Skermanella stibiiresistens SB22]|uniref:Sugar fermentation stimulation protein homolog n=1 Tax=Skermanella stibiiresistens SB22 TaxID=1385369 RepID=W9H7H6_9PROT|nr:DNA/RNA nuclease SfsA [Skermanella stibiiresistens]EWY42014.1 XRE family transcriptional regulator [Skermanella stibiiresistens SB22]